MKKSVRINLLVITIVVTLFIFAGLWYLRPGVSAEILQQAQIRQSQPLMEINEPLRKPKAEDLIDTAQLAKDLKRDLEPSIKASIKAELLADPAFARAVNQQVDVQAIQNQIQPAIMRGVSADLSSDSAFINTIASQLDLSAIQAANDQALVAVSEANDQAIASLRRDINAQIAALPKTTAVVAADEEEARRMIAQVVDAQIPVVVEAVVARIEANRDVYIEAVRSELGDVVLEDEVVDLYLGYRNALVQDLVPAILDDIEALLKGEPTVSEVAIAGEVKKTPAKPEAPVTLTPSVVSEAPSVPAVSEAPAVPSVPAPPTAAKIKVTTKAMPMPAVAETEPAVVETEPAVAETEPAVAETEPAVAEETVPAYEIDEVAYEVERQRLRTEAINEVLKKIGQ